SPEASGAGDIDDGWRGPDRYRDAVMLQRVDLRGRVRGTTTAELRASLPRPEVAGEGPVAAVRSISDDVRARGDAALRELTAKFDGCDLPSPRVDPADVRAALDRIDPALREALEFAADGIRAFHETQVHPPHRYE